MEKNIKKEKNDNMPRKTMFPAFINPLFSRNPFEASLKKVNVGVDCFHVFPSKHLPSEISLPHNPCGVNSSDVPANY